MSLKLLIWFVFLGFLAIAGAMAAATDAQARGRERELANCTSVNGCGLSAAVITSSSPRFGDVGGWTRARAGYGVVESAAPEISAALPREESPRGSSAAASVGITPDFTPSGSTPIQIYTEKVNFAADEQIQDLQINSPRSAISDPDAFYYDFSDRWQVRASALDDGDSAALRAIAAGEKTNPEDLLWHLADSEFSVKFGLVRRF